MACTAEHTVVPLVSHTDNLCNQVSNAELHSCCEVGAEIKAAFEPLTLLMGEVLDGKVHEVALSYCLTGSPCALAKSEPDSPMWDVWEINPIHPIVTDLQEKAVDGMYDKLVETRICVMFDASLLMATANHNEPLRLLQLSVLERCASVHPGSLVGGKKYKMAKSFLVTT